jgi:hypothetical protein
MSKSKFSSAYHPQTDDQSERVNQRLENYLRCLTFQNPKKWKSHLSTTEWWYNTSFHSSLKTTPFQALYGFSPPMITENLLPDSVGVEARDMMLVRQTALQNIKNNLKVAQERMKRHADKKRTKRTLQVGDMAYLKLQPYGHNALSVHRSLKLHSKFYGPFIVLQKVGQVAYKLLLPKGCSIHPFFHVSRLKQHVGPKVIPQANLPLVDSEGNIKMYPEKLLESHATMNLWCSGSLSGSICRMTLRHGKMLIS